MCSQIQIHKRAIKAAHKEEKVLSSPAELIRKANQTKAKRTKLSRAKINGQQDLCRRSHQEFQ